MPNYDYECLNCAKAFEAFQKITDGPLEKCPECGGKVRRLIGCGSGIIFKGSGFYATDYRKKSGPSSEKKEPCPGAKEGCAGCPRSPLPKEPHA